MFRELPSLNERKRSVVTSSGPVLSLVLSKDKRFMLFGCLDGELTIMTDPNVQHKPAETNPLVIKEKKDSLGEKGEKP